MTTTPYARVQVSINSGTAQPGGIDSVPANAIIQLSAVDTTLWTKASWRIYGPPGWSTPGGWTHDTSDDSAVYVGATENPPAFTLPAATGWGKWMISLVVNDGQKFKGRSSDLDADMTDTSTALSMRSPNGTLEDIGWTEDAQFSATRTYVRAQQNAIRGVELAITNAAAAVVEADAAMAAATVSFPYASRWTTPRGTTLVALKCDDTINATSAANTGTLGGSAVNSNSVQLIKGRGLFGHWILPGQTANGGGVIGTASNAIPDAGNATFNAFCVPPANSFQGTLLSGWGAREGAGYFYLLGHFGTKWRYTQYFVHGNTNVDVTGVAYNLEFDDPNGLYAPPQQIAMITGIVSTRTMNLYINGVKMATVADASGSGDTGLLPYYGETGGSHTIYVGYDHLNDPTVDFPQFGHTIDSVALSDSVIDGIYKQAMLIM